MTLSLIGIWRQVTLVLIIIIKGLGYFYNYQLEEIHEECGLKAGIRVIIQSKHLFSRFIFKNNFNF